MVHPATLLRCSVSVLLLGTFIILNLESPIWAQSLSAPVTFVADGDTFHVRRGQMVSVVRLEGVDCPELQQNYGRAAKDFTAGLILGKPVRIDVRYADKFKRLVSRVRLIDGRSLNAEVVRSGACRWYPKFAPNDQELRRLEESARTAKSGLWAAPKPQAPWSYRRERDKAKKAKKSQPLLH